MDRSSDGRQSRLGMFSPVEDPAQLDEVVSMIRGLNVGDGVTVVRPMPCKQGEAVRSAFSPRAFRPTLKSAAGGKRERTSLSEGPGESNTKKARAGGGGGL